MALRLLDDIELEQFGLENDAQAIEESAVLKPLAPKEIENLKLLRKGTMAYDLAEKYKDSWGLDAESLAQRADVKDMTGLPDFVLDRKPEVIKETIDKKKFEKAPKVDWNEMEKAYPITGNFLGANMGFAWDDIDNLKQHESIFSKMGTAFSVGKDIGTVGRLGTRQMYFESDNKALEQTISSYEKGIEERQTKLAESSLPERMLQGLAEITGQQVETLRKVLTYGSAGMVAGSFVPGVGNVIGAVGGAVAGLSAGAMFGAAESIFSMEAGNAWREYKDIPGVDDDVAKVAASIVGLANMGSEVLLGLGSIVSPFKSAFAKLGIGGADAVRNAMLLTLQRPTARTAIKNFTKTYGTTYIENVAQEVVQQATTQMGGLAATKLSGIDESKYTDLNQFVTSLVQEAKGAAETFALVPMLGSATNLSVDLNRANRATQNTELFNELAVAAKDSKVRQRLPRAYRELIASATKDGGLETIYIDSEKFQTVFGQSAADVAEELGITEEYETSLTEGGDLAVNTATYAEKIAGTDAHSALAGGIRLKEGEMTADEAQAFLGEYEAEKQKSIEEAKLAIAQEDAYGADLEMVRQETKDMLLSNGLNAEEAESNALLWTAWVNTLAKSRGIMPSEQNKEIGMRIGLPEETQDGAVLGQRTPDIKQKQFEIISISNPMTDNIHTGIRTVDDIMTAEEAFTETEDDFTDDFTKQNMNKALKSKQITIYSSYPIAKGVFVTPSKMEAQAYAGKGNKVYSKKVRLEDVAWIDAGQGQYAPIDGNGTVLDQPVYHGTPYRGIDRFSLEKVGTGEGAQAYGYGLYFAENKEIAEWYRKSLSSEYLSINGRSESDGMGSNKGDGSPEETYCITVASSLYNTHSTTDDIADKMKKNFNSEIDFLTEEIADTKNDLLYKTKIEHRLQLVKKRLEWIEKHQDSIKIHKGQTYKVDIPDDTGQYLIWDTAFSEQSEAVKTAWKESKISERSIYELRVLKRNENAVKSGEEFYSELSENLGSDESASSWLNEHGIIGIKYKDATARGKDKESYNYVMFNEDAIQILEEIYNQDTRGQVSFTEGQSLISFFKSRDASTFAHEMGHIMLKMTEMYALQSVPDSQIAKDFATLKEYLGMAEGETFASIGQERYTEAHEKFARTFEGYLMTGEAPSVGLKRTFRKFKEWLIGIYKEVSALNVEISLEVKAVFDRMIATEDEITEVETLANYKKDVTQMEGVEVTAEEAELYGSLKEEAEAEARETMLGRLMKPIERLFKKDKQIEYAKAMAKKLKEIRAILEKEPVNRIRTLLAISEKKGGITFDYYESAAIMNDLVSSLGMAVTFGEREISDIDTIIPTFNSKWFRKEGGTDPEVIAMEYGYSSASEMFLDLATARDIDKVAQEKAKAELDAELNVDIDPESIRLASEKAIRGKNRLELLGIEWLILAKKGKAALKMASARARVQAAKRSAEKHLDGLLWKDAIAFKRFIALERKAALAAERAILNKDMDTALAQKELQIINAALASESMARKTASDTMVKYLKKMAGRSRKQTFGIAPDALDQIDTLLERYEFKKVSEEEALIRRDIAEWVDEQQELGIPIDLPEDMQRQLKLKDYNTLTYNQLEGLYNTVKAIEKIGKGIMLFKKAEEAQTYDEAVDALKKSLEKQKVTRKHITSSDPNMRKLEALHKIPDAVNAQLEKAQATLLMLDGTKGIDKPGAFTDILWRPFADAIDTKVLLLKDYTDRIDKAILKHYGKGNWSKFLKRKVFIKELDFSLTGEQIFCVYMNWGTENNKTRLMEGKKWSEQQVEAIISKLDKKALDLGQDIRDIIGTLFPMMKALNREVLGYEPKTEEAVPIATQYGTYRGGYYPLVVDYSKLVDLNRTDEYEEGLSKSQPPFRAATRQGAYKARASHASYQVRLDLGGLRKHLEQVTHDLAFRKAVIDANKILSNKELRTMIAERVGKIGLQVLDNWVRDVATPPATPTDALSNTLRHQRHAITAAIIMFKLSVLMLQSSGWFNSANILGKNTARAMAMYYARPWTWAKDWKFVMDMSPFMVERNGLIETSMREFLLDKQFGQMSRMDKKIAMSIFNFSDGTITIPTWLEGYRVGLNLYKGDIDMAVGYADDIVRQTQGGSSIIDQTKLQRNQSELAKAISMFTQYFNVVYNLARRSGHDIKSVRNIPAFLGSLLVLFIAPAIYEGMLRDDDQPEEDEEGMFGGWGKWASIKSVNYAMATVPVLRDVGPYTMAKITGVGYTSSLRLSPMTAALESYIRTAKILLDSDAEWEDRVEKGTESASYLTGFSLQLHTIAWNLYHYLNDDQPDLDLAEITKKQYRR